MHHTFIGGDAVLSAGTPLISPYDLCSDTVNSSDIIVLTCGLLVNDAVERSGKIWGSHTVLVFG